MSSAAQIAANRANAAHSTGPSTDAGKATTRLNATRHGLTSQVACMPHEDRDAFNRFCAAMAAEYRPEGLIETELSQSIAEDHWRLHRVRAIDHNIFALGHATATPQIESGDPDVTAALLQAQTFREEAKTLGLLSLYEQRISRNLHRNIERLRLRQQDRYEAFEKALAIRREQRDAERAEAASTTVRSSDSQPERLGLIPTEGPQEQRPVVRAIGSVFSNNDSTRITRRRSLDDRLAEIELFMADPSNPRPTGLRRAA